MQMIDWITLVTMLLLLCVIAYGFQLSFGTMQRYRRAAEKDDGDEGGA